MIKINHALAKSETWLNFQRCILKDQLFKTILQSACIGTSLLAQTMGPLNAVSCLWGQPAADTKEHKK